MIFSRTEDSQGRIKIKDINELRAKKIKPSDLNKIYVDEQGQEYKLKYDPVNKKAVVVKIVKGILNGKYIKTQYDNIARDKKVEAQVKSKMAELSKEALPTITGHSNIPTVNQGEKKELPKPKDDIKPLNIIEDMFAIMEHSKDILKMAEKNIFDSEVLSEKYSIDDKIMLDELSRLITNSIISEFQTAKERYEDLLHGYDDNRLKSKLYKEEIKNIIDNLPTDKIITYLRDLESINIFKTSFELMLKAFDDIEYKVSTIPQDKIESKKFHDRQKFEDAIFLIKSVQKECKRIYAFLNELEEKLIQNR